MKAAMDKVDQQYLNELSMGSESSAKNAYNVYFRDSGMTEEEMPVRYLHIFYAKQKIPIALSLIEQVSYHQKAVNFSIYFLIFLFKVSRLNFTTHRIIFQRICNLLGLLLQRLLYATEQLLNPIYSLQYVPYKCATKVIQGLKNLPGNANRSPHFYSIL